MLLGALMAVGVMVALQRASTQASDPTVPSITLGKENVEQLLFLDSGGDVDTDVAQPGQPPVEARRTGNGQALPSADGNQIADFYMQFRLDDSVLFKGHPTTRVRIDVEYLDRGVDEFRLQYDAQSGGLFSDGRFKEASPVRKTGSNGFKIISFDLEDAYFGNRDNGADFRIDDRGDGAEIIRRVSVTLQLTSTSGTGHMVDPTTMDRKLLMGYQGWFACPGDGSPVNQWVHWFRSNTPDAASATFDYWPDTSQLEPDELCPTQLTQADGEPAPLYSAYNQKTVVRHFRWMQEHDLDGILLQRFSSELQDPRFFALRNQVAQNVRAGAERYGRVFAIMYDISGHPAATLVEDLKRDWAYLVDTLRITESVRYLRHRGKPVLAIWGLGFSDRPGTPAQAMQLIEYFKNNPDPRYRVTLMGGVPTQWRTLNGDSKSDPAWAGVYRSFDVLSPWAVGRYGDEAGADDFMRRQIMPDLVEATAQGVEYMPVVFPGFSWHNLLGGPLNQIPRNGGRFYWRQVYNAVRAYTGINAPAVMLYGAMFDEVDEGTAMFNMAATAAELPAQGSFVPLDIDGFRLPADWYLRLAGEAGKMLRGEIPLSATLPLAP